MKARLTKRFFFITVAVHLFFATAAISYAETKVYLPGASEVAIQQNEQAVYEQAYREKMSGTSNTPRPLPDHFSKTNVPLTAHEKETLRLARKWAETPNKPIRLANGKVAFMHGASIPTIISSPFNITDIEFEPGESIQGVLLGDTARWQVESGAVGNIPHIFVKPLDTGLETSAVITTTRRVYHLRLVSQRTGFMPYIGFVYQNRNMAIIKAQQQRQEQQAHYQSTVINGSVVDLTTLDFKYEVDGTADWRPVQVYNDGLKTYIKLPEKVEEMPILLAENQGEILVNYRVENNTFIVDGTFKKLILVLGVGFSQQKVTIEKQS